MNELVARLTIAAQEAHRVNRLPVKGAGAYPVRVALEVDVRGVCVIGRRGPSIEHRYVVPWSEIEAARVNLIVSQIGKTIEALTVWRT